MTPAQFLGKLLGSLICAAIFGAIGVWQGLRFPWSDATEDEYRDHAVNDEGNQP